MTFRLSVFILLLLIVSSASTFKSEVKISGYNLSKPDAVSILPDILIEISGLTEIDKNTFACVQDENGILFIYDAIKNEIKKQYTFYIDGDYEGITRVNKTIYVLRSDGTIFEISDYESPHFKVNQYQTKIPALNNEGLCYDEVNNRLLVACKGKVGKGPELKDKRAIYAFDLKTKLLGKEPVFDFNIETIKKFAIDKKINLPVRNKKKGQIADPIIKFATSAIAIHPIKKQLYLLSSSDHMLFIFNMNGEIKHLEILDPVLFNKAEGITFLKNGDMLITNEGQYKKPTLLRFNYIPSKD